MKYKVSLLPERNRKRIIGKKKAEKGRSVANVVLLVLLGAVLITLLGKLYADNKLTEIQAQNQKYSQQVSALQKYRDINNSLQAKVKLIDDIQVEEPSLYNFMARLGNAVHPGISVDKMDCLDWKTTRTCTLNGTAISRDAFTEYFNTLSSIKGVSSVTCTSYTMVVNNGKAEANFSITLSCEGGAAPIVAETTSETTTEASK